MCFRLKELKKKNLILKHYPLRLRSPAIDLTPGGGCCHHEPSICLTSALCTAGQHLGFYLQTWFDPHRPLALFPSRLCLVSAHLAFSFVSSRTHGDLFFPGSREITPNQCSEWQQKNPFFHCTMKTFEC